MTTTSTWLYHFVLGLSVQTLLDSIALITVADEEKPNLKKDDANFPWGI